MKNLFNFRLAHPQSEEHQFGAKVIPFRDHKSKTNKKKQQGQTRGHGGDSLARNLKSHTGLRRGSKLQKKASKHSSKKPTAFYVSVFVTILFGLFILFGGLSSFFK